MQRLRVRCTAAAAEDVAEAYLLGHMSRQEEQSFEEHFLCCEVCASAVESAAIFIRAFRAAVA